jgi:PAS domain S-box-containing protein
MIPRRSIKAQLVFSLAVLAVSLVAWDTFTVVSQYRDSRAQAALLVEDIAHAISGSLELVLRDQLHVLEALGADSILIRGENPACSNTLAASARLLRLNLNLIVVDAEGDLACSGMGVPGPDFEPLGDRSWFQSVSRDLEVTVGELVIGRHTERWVIPLAIPILNADGTFRSTLVATLDAEFFNEFVGDLGVTEEALITVAERGVTVIARSRDWAGTVGQALPATNPGLDLAGNPEGTSVAQDQDGVMRYWAYTTVPGTEWVVFVGLPESYIRALPMATAIRAVGTAIVTLLVIMALVTWVYSGVLDSLHRLVEGSRAAVDGDLGRIPASGPREIVEVGRAFRATLEQRLKAESEGIEADARWRSILDNAVFGVLLAREDGTIEVTNPAMAEILEADDIEELIGRNIASLFWVETHGEEFLNDLLLFHSVQGVEYRWRTCKDHLRTLRLTASRVDAGDRPDQVEVFAEDISVQHDLQVQLLQAQKMEAVGRLAGGVAHDFNNLLTVIQGHSEILLSKLTEEDRAYRNASEILKASERAADLTGQLLSFSRKGREEESSAIDLNLVIEDMEQLCRRLIGEHVEMALDLGSELPAVAVPTGRLEQVILNLVVNARDAMPDGGRMTIRTRATPSPLRKARGPWVAMEVEDQGTGIPEEVRERMFDPFFTTKASGEGTGLGLSTVYGIVSGAGGQIQVDSELGRGSKFTVLLPGGTATDVEMVEAPEVPEEVGPSTGGLVLVVEDEEQVREIVVRVLGEAGFRTLQARNGEEGIEVAVAEGGSLDLVVSDVVMPRLKGPEMMARLHQLYPELRVLYVSGYAGGSIAPSDLTDPRVEFMDKPFRPPELLRRVRALLAPGRLDQG